MENAPELFQTDQDWIISETRAHSAVFLRDGESPNPAAESFEVDGSKLYFIAS